MSEGPVSSNALRRSFLVGILVFAVFAVLMIRILIIQTVDFDKYQSKVINQMTTESPVAADRGKIYDTNGNVLATNITTYRAFISPSSIQSAQDALEEGSNVRYADMIAKGLSELLGVSYDSVYKQATEYTRYLDRTIKRKVDEETADRVREFIDANKLQTMVYLEAQSTRYYPANSLASHILGFTSSDGVGLYGLEYQYNEYLSGVDGYYIKARDSYGNEMPFDYASYIEAVDGYNLHTTIDSSVQNFLEEQLEQTVSDHAAQNRACGIVMNVKTGAILAMATSGGFNLNDPWAMDAISSEKLASSGYAADSEEYSNLQRDLLTSMWSNKAVTESYIPGSTFKIITSSMALEENKVNLTESVSCPGYKVVLGHRIHCHKTTGHGSITFPVGLQQSCNVWFMTLGERVGVDKYTEYVKAFGYREKTGIDLPGEGSSIFTSEMSGLDLAIYAFGQNFNVTPIQQICAVAAVANGGKLVTPYLVDQITDNSGNIIYQHEVAVKRQVVSEETCKTVSKILEEGVSGNGGAKNAYVAGYRVAAKTGTSEKKNAGKEGMYICSTVAYAPADDPEIAMIIIVDEPTQGVLYGSVVAAPYVAAALENIMPYLGVEARYTDAELAKKAVKVGSYTNWSLASAQEAITKAGLTYRVVGSGDTVKRQTPAAGTTIERTSGCIVLYLGDAKPSDSIEVPDLMGKTAIYATQSLVNLGLNVRIVGSSSYLSGTGARVCAQSVAAGTMVPAGTVITITFYEEGSEGADY